MRRGIQNIIIHSLGKWQRITREYRNVLLPLLLLPFADFLFTRVQFAFVEKSHAHSDELIEYSVVDCCLFQKHGKYVSEQSNKMFFLLTLFFVYRKFGYFVIVTHTAQHWWIELLHRQFLTIFCRCWSIRFFVCVQCFDVVGLHMMRALKTNLKCRHINSCTHYYRGEWARKRSSSRSNSERSHHHQFYFFFFFIFFCSVAATSARMTRKHDGTAAAACCLLLLPLAVAATTNIIIVIIRLFNGIYVAGTAASHGHRHCCGSAIVARNDRRKESERVSGKSKSDTASDSSWTHTWNEMNAAVISVSNSFMCKLFILIDINVTASLGPNYEIWSKNLGRIFPVEYGYDVEHIVTNCVMFPMVTRTARSNTFDSRAETRTNFPNWCKCFATKFPVAIDAVISLGIFFTSENGKKWRTKWKEKWNSFFLD